MNSMMLHEFLMVSMRAVSRALWILMFSFWLLMNSVMDGVRLAVKLGRVWPHFWFPYWLWLSPWPPWAVFCWSCWSRPCTLGCRFACWSNSSPSVCPRQWFCPNPSKIPTWLSSFRMKWSCSVSRCIRSTFSSSCWSRISICFRLKLSSGYFVRVPLLKNPCTWPLWWIQARLRSSLLRRCGWSGRDSWVCYYYLWLLRVFLWSLWWSFWWRGSSAPRARGSSTRPAPLLFNQFCSCCPRPRTTFWIFWRTQ